VCWCWWGGGGGGGSKPGQYVGRRGRCACELCACQVSRSSIRCWDELARENYAKRTPHSTLLRCAARTKVRTLNKAPTKRTARVLQVAFTAPASSHSNTSHHIRQPFFALIWSRRSPFFLARQLRRRARCPLSAKRMKKRARRSKPHRLNGLGRCSRRSRVSAPAACCHYPRRRSFNAPLFCSRKPSTSSTPTTSQWQEAHHQIARQGRVRSLRCRLGCAANGPDLREKPLLLVRGSNAAVREARSDCEFTVVCCLVVGDGRHSAYICLVTGALHPQT